MNAPSQPSTRSAAALAWFLGVALGGVFLVGGLIVALDVALYSPAFYAFYAVGLLTPFAGALAYARRATGSFAPVLRMYAPPRLGAGWPMVVAVPLTLVPAYVLASGFGVPLDWGAADPAVTLLGSFLGWSSVMWAEETGWRGTLLPDLQDRWGPLAATVGVALVWALWHVPLVALIGMDVTGFGLFTLQVLGLSAAMTWAVNRSQSVVVAVLVHGAWNAAAGWALTAVPSMTANELIGVQAAGPLALGLLLVLVTRGRLGATSAASSPARPLAAAAV